MGSHITVAYTRHLTPSSAILCRLPGFHRLPNRQLQETRVAMHTGSMVQLLTNVKYDMSTGSLISVWHGYKAQSEHVTGSSKTFTALAYSRTI